MSNSSHPYLNNLTPLRGIAALWVAAYHLKISPIGFAYPLHSMLLSKGYMMVDLFFIMSGFIIRHVYGDRFAQQIKKPDLKRFIVARFARIYPLHFFTLAFIVLQVAFSGEWNWVNDPAAIPTHLLLLQSFGFHKLATWNRFSWSLSAEWAAYMIFPFLAILFSQRRKLCYWLFPPLIITAYVALLYWLPPRGFGNADRLILHKLDVTYDYGFLRGIAGFILGMLSYELYSKVRIRCFFSQDWVAVIIISVMLLSLHRGVNDLLIVVSFVGVVLSFACNGGLLYKICSLKPAQFIGKVSYSIYLVQGIATTFFSIGVILSGLYKSFPPFVPASFFSIFFYLITYLAFLVLLSSITYYGIENPCRNFINRMYMRRPVAKETIFSQNAK